MISRVSLRNSGAWEGWCIYDDTPDLFLVLVRFKCWFTGRLFQKNRLIFNENLWKIDLKRNEWEFIFPNASLQAIRIQPRTNSGLSAGKLNSDSLLFSSFMLFEVNVIILFDLFYLVNLLKILSWRFWRLVGPAGPGDSYQL